jgi:hypothetical protein
MSPYSFYPMNATRSAEELRSYGGGKGRAEKGKMALIRRGSLGTD